MCLIRALFSARQTRVMAVAAEFQELSGLEYGSVSQVKGHQRSVAVGPKYFKSKCYMYDETLYVHN